MPHRDYPDLTDLFNDEDIPEIIADIEAARWAEMTGQPLRPKPRRPNPFKVRHPDITEWADD